MAKLHFDYLTEILIRKEDETFKPVFYIIDIRNIKLEI